MRDGRVPDLGSLSAHIYEIRVGARLRGAEAAAAGEVVEEKRELRLKVAGGGEAFRLAPLTGKVQWDAALNREEEATPREHDAYRRLRAAPAGGGAGPVQVVGPVREIHGGGPRILEVRSFRRVELIQETTG